MSTCDSIISCNPRQSTYLLIQPTNQLLQNCEAELLSHFNNDAGILNIHKINSVYKDWFYNVNGLYFLNILCIKKIGL